jgi:hypothetical protein
MSSSAWSTPTTRARRVRFTSRGRAGLLDGLAVLGALEDEYAAKIGKRRMKELQRALISLLVQVEGPAPTSRRGSGSLRP